MWLCCPELSETRAPGDLLRWNQGSRQFRPEHRGVPAWRQLRDLIATLWRIRGALRRGNRVAQGKVKTGEAVPRWVESTERHWNREIRPAVHLEVVVPHRDHWNRWGARKVPERQEHPKRCRSLEHRGHCRNPEHRGRCRSLPRPARRRHRCHHQRVHPAHQNQGQIRGLVREVPLVFRWLLRAGP